MNKFIDLTGQKFEKLIVAERVDNNSRGDTMWRCICDCGKEIITRGNSLRSGHTRSCGCLCRWTKEEDNILKQFYQNNGSEYCSKLINRTKGSILIRAQELNLKTIVVSSNLPKKTIIKKLSDKQVLSICKIHGETIHYYHDNKIRRCLRCKNIQMIEHNKNPFNNLISRLRFRIRHSLNNILKDSKGILNGAFRNLPYSQLDLFNHIENIKKQQRNCCPICNNNYDEVGFNIEHIIPLKIAKTEQEIINLFALSNLSLMCGSCNSSKGKKDYNIWMESKNVINI